MKVPIFSINIQVIFDCGVCGGCGDGCERERDKEREKIRKVKIWLFVDVS